MPAKPEDSVDSKVFEIFRAAFGERAQHLSATAPALAAKQAVRDAFLPDEDPKVADELGFHLADWGSDAAFVVALHLFPEQFTAEEIRAASHALAAHVPYHAAAAAQLLGYPGADFLDEHEKE
jgi:hypothetical protein